MSGEFDEFVTRMNHEVALTLARNETEELLSEIERLAPTYPPQVFERVARIREAYRVADRLKRQLVLEVAG